MLSCHFTLWCIQCKSSTGSAFQKCYHTYMILGADLGCSTVHGHSLTCFRRHEKNKILQVKGLFLFGGRVGTLLKEIKNLWKSDPPLNVRAQLSTACYNVLQLLNPARLSTHIRELNQWRACARELCTLTTKPCIREHGKWWIGDWGVMLYNDF